MQSSGTQILCEVGIALVATCLQLSGNASQRILSREDPFQRGRGMVVQGQDLFSPAFSKTPRFSTVPGHVLLQRLRVFQRAWLLHEAVALQVSASKHQENQNSHNVIPIFALIYPQYYPIICNIPVCHAEVYWTTSQSPQSEISAVLIVCSFQLMLYGSFSG